MKTTKLAAACGLSLSLGVCASAMAEGLSANIGAVSNYMWRGVTQTQDDPAIQGGIDYGFANGLYVGTWVSNVDFGSSKPNYEIDGYGGYAGEFGDFSYDLSGTYYAYPDADGDADFFELGASGTWKVITLGLAYTAWGEVSDGPFDTGDLYYYGSVEIPLPKEFSIGATLGYYDFDDDKAFYETSAGTIRSKSLDYTHWGVNISKDVGEFGTFSLNYDQNDGSTKIGYDNDAKFWVGWLKEF